MKKRFGYMMLLVSGAVVLGGCSGKEVSFKKDVMPIFAENCHSCHQENGQGYMASGFNVSSYETIMQGTKHGPIIKPGASVASTLQILLEHRANPAINMPKGAPKLSESKIKIITDWIDQGAKDN